MLKCKSNGVVKTLIQTGDAIGGRNLFRNTLTMPIGSVNKGEYGTYSGSSSLIDTEDGVKMTYCGQNTPQGMLVPISYKNCVGNDEIVTLSFEYRGNPPENSAFYFIQASGFNVVVWFNSVKLIHDEENWHKFTVSFSSPEATIRTFTHAIICYEGVDSSKWIEIKKGSLKLERGLIATDWTPAPEDFQSQIDELKAQITALGG
ncbi:hypothetical protein [Faecalibaculum rodentium]|uniref:hypothetical protein n=1 Tax=Faecalibaculum rodentium TaxID=1702221 RepID=UPI002731EECA|nr:hypothetical protein [Faecalibaculum rodentium]